MNKPGKPTDELLNVWPWNLMYASMTMCAAESEMQGYKDATYRIYLPAFQNAYDRLAERERTVLEMRFLDGKTYEECGKHFNVTRERIRQVEQHAMRKLRGQALKMVMNPAEVFDEMRSRALKAEAEVNAYRKKIKNIRKVLGCPDTGNIPEEPEEKTGIDDMSIEDLELSVRSYNCLYRANIRTVGALKKLTYERLRRVRNLGRKSVDEIVAKLKELGIELEHEEVNA